MRVLILSSNNGGGHNAAAQALREVFEAHGDACRVEDCLSFISKNISSAIAGYHNFMYRRMPKLFDSGYRYTLKHPDTFAERHGTRRALNLGRGHLGRFIRDGDYDAVICTHVFAALMLTDAKRSFGLSLRTGVVETDYTATPGAHAAALDWHFIPSKCLRDELVQLGVDGKKIIPSGIPVRSPFYAPRHRAGNSRHLLVMGGSMGAGPVPEIVCELAREMDDRCAVSVVCGTNRRLAERLRAAHGGDRRVRVYGYMENVAALMDSADLLLTKPGGITVTEAAVKRLPMALVNAVAGCEAYNLRFFVDRGGAVTADNPRDLARLCLATLRDPATLADMSRALEPIAAANDREIIWRAMAQR